MFAKFKQKTTFSCFNEVETYLDNLGLFHMDLSLDRIQTVLQRLFPNGLPFKVAQIAGTNGKGSTAHFLASLATAHAINNGLFTSPHLLNVRERVRIKGCMLEPEKWTSYANIVYMAQDQNETQHLTYFEFITALALVAFADANVELAVLEAGLGGKYDATSAVFADLLLFTPIDYDHENILGQNILDIADNKAGAIKANQILLTAEQKPEVLNLLKEKAAAKGNKLFKPGAPKGACTQSTGLMGQHQQDNSRLALAGFTMLAGKLNWPLRPPAIARGLRNAFIPGRMQYIDGLFTRPPLLLDGAHNQHSFKNLDSNLKQMQIIPRAIIFSCLGDKNLDKVFHLLNEWTNGPIFIPPIANNPRAIAPEKLAAQIGPQAIAVPSLKKALELACKTPTPDTACANTPTPILICGSLYLLADFFELHPAYLEPDIKRDSRRLKG